MNAALRSPWFPMAVAAAVLASLLVFLYDKTRTSGEADYFANVALLRHIRQLDAQWELDVLRSRIGVNAHYDPLADSLTDLNTLLKTLASETVQQAHADAPALQQKVAALHAVIADKASRIEQFKSHNAVLRNSLAFLPTASDELVQSISAERSPPPPASARVSARVTGLLLDSVLYSQSPSAEKGSGIRSALDQLQEGLAGLPPAVHDSADIFTAHVQTILREQMLVNDLLGAIVAVPTATRIDEIQNALNNEQLSAQVSIRRYRAYLLLFSAVLAALLLYAAVHLLRSHAVIRRVNRQLKNANDHLEQRVQERTGELRQAQNELVSAARLAGMAEIATNVLHNVGNVLNSVNVSAGLISTQLRNSKLKGLARAVTLMDEHAANLGQFMLLDPRGKMLPTYLRELAAALEAENQAMAHELGALARSVDHIKQVIATQQSYAGTPRMVETLPLGELFDDALRMNADALTRHKVKVVKDLAALPPLPLDRHRLVQILVNLIGNAKQAMESVTDRLPCITLGALLTEGGRLRITVTDNGVGIAPENLTRVFSHGFTTRKNGHGFGLHSCVLAAQEMGGTLRAYSGAGAPGATFTLELPVRATANEP